ncbi:hypothetical protein Nepgr_025848 [Nepenthes gracilis]|uniref:Uncharacterized protein n=1 Tax=Nepenthes gracilis TaxID=150966 RepID=A0AAD3T5R7_NEPGR|nr:hypothetical protein Nepgr_025848 [Nepenthes gracilis]
MCKVKSLCTTAYVVFAALFCCFFVESSDLMNSLFSVLLFKFFSLKTCYLVSGGYCHLWKCFDPSCTDGCILLELLELLPFKPIPGY